jgi:hypothetical protein
MLRLPGAKGKVSLEEAGWKWLKVLKHEIIPKKGGKGPDEESVDITFISVSRPLFTCQKRVLQVSPGSARIPGSSDTAFSRLVPRLLPLGAVTVPSSPVLDPSAVRKSVGRLFLEYPLRRG